MGAGRIGTSVVGRGMRRLLLAVLVCALGASLAAALTASGRAGRGAATEPRHASAASDLCTSSAPIPASALAGGLDAGCSLTGRTVVSGKVEVQVPPPGVTVAADGIGSHGESRSLVVSDRGGVVSSGSSAAGAAAAAASSQPTDCRSSQYVLENGGHPWSTTVHWKLRNASVPARMKVTAVASRLKAAFAAWRFDHNDCGLTGQPKRLRDTYDGWTSTPTGIGMRSGTLKCGSFNHTNTVDIGHLPGDLLGWTCYWWGTHGSMIAFDTRLSSSTALVLALPRGCRNKWDLQSVATHEFGHAIGLGHVSNASQTMHGVAPACTTAPRTIGRGDRLGLKALYGIS